MRKIYAEMSFIPQRKSTFKLQVTKKKVIIPRGNGSLDREAALNKMSLFEELEKPAVYNRGARIFRSNTYCIHIQ